MLPGLNYGWRVHDFALRPLEEDKRVNLLIGSVRSGKTWTQFPKIFHACFSPIAGDRVFIGQTAGTVYTNILKPLFDLISERDYHYSSNSGYVRIFGKEWRILGARDLGSEKYVRGATIGVAVCDEVVLMPESFWDMLLTRLSPAGARLYGTSNPDNPMHWLKIRFIDEAIGKLKNEVFHMQMTIDDNPNLGEEYKQTLKNFYKGMFYKRFILGLWVMAEGAIWGDCWDDALLYCQDDCELNHVHEYAPVTLKNAGGFVDHFVSNDYGTNHPHVYHEFWDDGTTLWLDREWVWDSKERMRQLTDGEYANALVDFMGPNNSCQVIIPPDALSFRQECVNRGLWVTVANDEHEGIQTVAGMMATRKLRVNRKCVRTIRGINAYVWDSNKAKRGVEEPVAHDDDEASSLRYGVHSKIPKWRYMMSA